MKKGKYHIQSDHKGFSLIELIIVVTIMAVLTGILVPMYLQHVENANIAKDVDTLNKIAQALTLEYTIGGYTPQDLYEDYFGGTTDTNHLVADMYNAGEPVLEISKKGIASKSYGQPNFQPGGYIYDSLAATGVNVEEIRTKGSTKLFYSKTLQNAIARSSGENGYKHIMMTMDENDVIHVWVGSRGYGTGSKAGKHSTTSLPDARFSTGDLVYE